MSTLHATMSMMRAISRASNIKLHRGFADYYTDQIVKAGTQQSLLGFIERLAGSVNVELEYIGGKTVADFLTVVNASESQGVLSWLRSYPRVASMICCSLKTEEDFDNALKDMTIPDVGEMGTAMPGCTPNLPMVITCLSPLAHGADKKAGNSTLYRRQECRSTTGQILVLPVYAANAIRGNCRRLLAWNWTQALGLQPSHSNPPYSEWFYYALFSGGKLEENSQEAKALSKELGSGSGAVRTTGLHKFRDMVLPLSIFGTALGNRTVPRRFDNLDFKPRCQEWNTGDLNAASLFTWEFLTRKDDYEGRVDGQKSAQMIANTECLMQGTVLDGGIDILDHATELERSCIGKMLSLFQQSGKLGAENRKGEGNVKIEFPEGYPDPGLYDAYVAEKTSEILDYLESIGGLKNASLFAN